MTFPFEGDYSDDSTVKKMEVALRSGWHTLELARDLQEQGQIADATAARACANRAYRRAAELLPHVEDEQARILLTRAIEELESLLPRAN
jgi:hypothetical protein